MKKRIISLILVVATMFLTLTGCAFNYAKSDVTKYTTFNTDAFTTALTKLVIADGDFGTDEEARKAKVQDAIAAAILKVTDTTDKKYAGKAELYDSLAYCYFATDADGNIFFASSLDESKATSVQLGLSSLEGLNKLISEKVLEIEDLAGHIYTTSAATTVGDKDAISISYEKSHTVTEGEETKTVVDETVDNKYVVIDSKDAFHALLIGSKVGIDLGSFEVEESKTEGEGENAVTTKTTYTYSNVKVESIAKDNSTEKVDDGEAVYISYTMTYPTWEGFELPENAKGTLDADGNYSETVSYTCVVAKADAEPEQNEDGTTPEKVVTFLGSLVGKNVGSTTSSIKVKETVAEGHENVEVTYKNVKVHWTLDEESVGAPIEIKYTPYDEALNDAKTNKKTAKDVYGKEHTLNQVELTYYVCPVYYIDVETLSAEVVIREFYSTVASTEEIEHDENEEHDHSAMTEYVFDTLNDKEYKNGDKVLADLVTELVELYKTHTTDDKAVTDALKSLNTAQSSLAKYTGTSESEKANLDKAVVSAHEKYVNAVKKLDETQAKVDAKIEEILGCKKGETSVADGLVKDYETYQYDTLEDAYKADITKKLAKEIIALAKSNVSYTNLPKKAVKDAKKAILNTYKNTFYEGNYSTGSSTSSTTTETNYHHYVNIGGFDAFLMDQFKVTTMAEVESAIQKEAEETVKEILLIYVLVDVVGADKVALTKEEKKNLETNLKNTALLYQQYGLSFEYNVDDYLHAEQFDKIINYLLEEKEVDGNRVEFEHIQYSFDEAEDK